MSALLLPACSLAVSSADAATVRLRSCIFTIGGWCPLESIFGSLLAMGVVALIFAGGAVLLRGLSGRPAPPPQVQQQTIPDHQLRAYQKWVDQHLARFLKDLGNIWIAHYATHKTMPLGQVVREFLPTAVEWMRVAYSDLEKVASPAQALDLVVIAIRRSGTHSDDELIAEGIIQRKGSL